MNPPPLKFGVGNLLVKSVSKMTTLLIEILPLKRKSSYLIMPLTVYKASAGSGKTYTLTRDYLQIAFRSPNYFERILAVSFTNKAAGEMKARILRELSALADGRKSDFTDYFLTQFGGHEQQLAQRATQCLQQILHNYHRFAVGTIDQFFQKVLRAFIRELKLQPVYKLQLDDSEVIRKAIDTLLLKVEESPELQAWLKEMALARIEEGKSWDFRYAIESFSPELSKEHFQEFREVLYDKVHDKTFMQKWLKQIHGEVKRFDKTLKEYGNRGLEAMESHGLSIDDFKGKGRGPAAHFKKLVEKEPKDAEPSTTARKALNDPGEFSTKTAPGDVVLFAEQTLAPLLREAMGFYDEHIKRYNTLNEVKRHIYVLGLVTDISAQVRTYCNDENLFLLSDTSRLIQLIIDGNEAPFLYEKVGNHYNHFMIDEFQDTSRLQWDNFRPLIANSLAEGHESLLVGDIKQSIYRWRNGDWDILARQVYQNFQHQGVETRTLDHNWRSKKQVVAFNNSLFRTMAQILQNELNAEFPDEQENPWADVIVDAYADTMQKVIDKPAKEGGFAKFEFVEREKLSEAREEVLAEKIPETLRKLQDKGYALKDIAILVRRGSEGQAVADALMACQEEASPDTPYRYDFISNDSLFLYKATPVRLLVALLSFVNDPVSLDRAAIVNEYARYIGVEEKGTHALFVDEAPDLLSDLPQWKHLAVHELVDRLIARFGLYKDQKYFPYLQVFQDVVHSYVQENPVDVFSFLTWWDQEGGTKTLTVNEQQDAIRIITIHKSKGLQFKAVLVPFCEWPIGVHGTLSPLMWCIPQEAPLNELPVVPFKYSKKIMPNSSFQAEYFQETMRQYVDNLNLAYVAFTRAEEALFAFAPAQIPSQKSKSAGHIGHMMKKAAEVFVNFFGDTPGEGFVDLTEKIEEKEQSWAVVVGDLSESLDEATESATLQLDAYHVYPGQQRLRMKQYAADYFITDREQQLTAINQGNLLHEAFSYIKTPEDVPAAVQRLVFDGKISTREQPDYEKKLSVFLAHPEARDWFSGSWQIHTENEIILPQKYLERAGHSAGKQWSYRPDRVLSREGKTLVIDFKFGETRGHHDGYVRQVQRYVSLLQDMGYQKVEGYLWYVKAGEVVLCNE
ncbi:MAG: UvrD-helicase domain-containing protein [Bacteroidales bacterium]